MGYCSCKCGVDLNVMTTVLTLQQRSEAGQFRSLSPALLHSDAVTSEILLESSANVGGLAPEGRDTVRVTVGRRPSF